MNNLSKKMIDENGKEETVIANSSDNYTVKLDKKYSLANRSTKKQNKFTSKFKSSIFGTDIGVKSGGFSSIAALAAVIALAALAVMYFIWRF